MTTFYKWALGGWLLLGGAWAAGAQTAGEKNGNATQIKVSVEMRPNTTEQNPYYTGNKAPLEPLSFLKLPIGSIHPEGWVRKYLELQRDGLTGHLAEISAWLDKKDNAWYSGTGQGGHGWEEVPYWLKGYGDLAYELKDQAMIAKTKDWLEKVFQSQQPDGYFGPSVVENEHQRNSGKTPDLWPNMLMLWCMQSYYEYSHDARVIDFMTKYFHWETTVPDSQMFKIFWENSRAGDNLYSVYWLYDITGEPWLLDLAVKIHRNTANWTQQNNLPNWHNVNVAQCFREPATYFMQTKDSFYLQATYHDFFLVRSLYGQVPGGMFGADENAREGYSDPRQAVETCGIVEQMASDELLTQITGDPMWADNCENVAFNTYPAAVMPDFRGLRYLTAPNMVVSDSMNHHPGIDNDGPFLVMNPFSSRCCQHNHSQGWPYYAEHLWMATPDRGVVAMLYCSSSVTVEVGSGEKVRLSESTHYPFDENIHIRVETAANFPLYLRVPGWCSGAKVKVNGETMAIEARGDTYIRLEKDWKAGDVVDLDLPMQIRTTLWSLNQGSISVNYGPLTFALKIKENYIKLDSRAATQGDAKWQPNVDATQWPAYEILPGSPWNYGLAGTQMEIVRRPWPKDDFPFTQNSTPIELKAKGRRIPTWTIDKYGLCGVLPASPVMVSTPEEDIELIPMGAARLRISAFPTVPVSGEPPKEGELAVEERWPTAKANAWGKRWGWLRGSNFIPSTAINQLEMWQKETFDTATIDMELGYAQKVGFNAMRVFLHHLAWEEDPEGFKNRINQYLDIANRRGIGTIFVFFDNCWNPHYQKGPQPKPKPGVHNSGWVQDPGATRDDVELETYVKDILKTFGQDNRIALWDLYNEPGANCMDLLKKVLEWAREANPTQPLTAGVWTDDLKDMNQFQLDHSDIITYHNYGSPEEQQKEIDRLKAYGRPIVCTEYMARTRGSLFTNIMPVLKQNNVGAINWGLVEGKTNTIYAWDTPMPDGSEPKVWFHDVFRKDGTPYSEKEIELITSLTHIQ